MRIITKKEIFSESNSSLAGTCAVRFYLDGNITFSKQAVDLMKMNDNIFFQLVEGHEGVFYLQINDFEGFRTKPRSDKSVRLCYSSKLIKYLCIRLNKKVSKGNPLEFSIKKTKTATLFQMVYDSNGNVIDLEKI